MNSFKKTGICPFDRNVFSDADFAMSRVTEKPESSLGDGADLNVTPSVNFHQEESQNNILEFDQPLFGAFPSPDSPEPVSIDTVLAAFPQVATQNKRFVTPAELKGFPKAKDKGSKRKPRSKGRCFIPTDTPEKMAIERQEREKQRRKLKKGNPKLQRNGR